MLDTNLTHNFVASGIHKLPLGLSISPIATIVSGAPLNLTVRPAATSWP